MKYIPLTQNQHAIVDDSDYDWLSQWKWYAFKDGQTFYALRTASRKAPGVRKKIRMHRIIIDAPNDMEVDHLNGDGLDNQRNNLRLATRSENGRNMRPQNAKSGYKGVYKNPIGKTWIAQAHKGNKKHYAGCYLNPVVAALAYDLLAFRIFGSYARPNFPIVWSYVNHLGSLMLQRRSR